jgi:hypothetical protein
MRRRGRTGAGEVPRVNWLLLSVPRVSMPGRTAWASTCRLEDTALDGWREELYRPPPALSTRREAPTPISLKCVADDPAAARPYWCARVSAGATTHRAVEPYATASGGP